MAENDVYNSERRYKRFKDNPEDLLLPPEKRKKTTAGSNGKYYCKNKANLAYFRKLFDYFDSKDLSFIRRNRLLGCMSLIVHATDKDLSECGREDINSIVAFMHQRYNTQKSKVDFIKDIKYLWKNLFQEKDEKGRIDETLTPYVVRHLSSKMDKSKEKRRKDKLVFEEFESLLQYFANDAQMQFYLMFSNESLVRPQEACYLRLSDIELYDNYAKIYLSEHGKEGVSGFLRSIDSFPYLLRWLEKHPYRNKKDSFLFVVEVNKHKGMQQSPVNFNKRIRKACENLGINKPITTYSLKRNGVSFKRLAGYSDAEIQHIARWTSTKQLKAYDLTDADDTLRIALIKKGLIEADEKSKELIPDLKKCGFCGKINAFTNVACENCKRPLDRSKIIEEEKKKEEEISSLKSQIEELKVMVMQIAKKEIEGLKNDYEPTTTPLIQVKP